MRQRLHMSAAKQMRLHQIETSEEGGRRTQNPRAAEKGGAQRPGQRKQNPRVAAVLNFKENPPRQAGNLLLKQQVLVRKPEKGIKRDLTGNQKGAKRIPRLRTTGPENSAKESDLHSEFCKRSGFEHEPLG
jgi:hypothetical protein